MDAWRVKQAESQENVRQLQLQLASARTRLAWFTEAIRKAEWKAIGVTENVKLEQPIKTPVDNQVLTDLPDEASLASLARQTRDRKQSCCGDSWEVHRVRKRGANRQCASGARPGRP